jgi:hypothetical protein
MVAAFASTFRHLIKDYKAFDNCFKTHLFIT